VALDRRGFVYATLAALAWLAGGARPVRAAEPTALGIHRATRNTRRGALGARLWNPGFRPTRAKRYAGSSRVALPTAAPRPGLPLEHVVRRWRPPPALAGALSLAELSRLLRHTNGLTGSAGGIALRAAPSAGALYAGELYLVAAAVEGLAPGAYYYAVHAHALVPLARGALGARVLDALERPGIVAAAPAFILVSNVFQRYTRRYRNRGYRYALIDTGHIGENLRLAAASAGLATVSPPRFRDESLDALLDLDGREEGVCALFAVGRALHAPAAKRLRTLAAKQRAGASLLRAGSEPERFHEATKLVPADAGDERTAEIAVPPLSGEIAPLPPREPVATTVEAAIAMRRSAQRFRAAPIALDELAWVLELAGGSAAPERTPGIEILVIAHRVTGLPPGIHRFERTRGLRRLRSGDVSAELADACLGQDKASSAAAGIAMVASIGPTAAVGGARSYRDLLIEAGAIAQRVYLAAEALGLAARNLAAFVDDELDALLGLDGSRRSVVHLTMLGPGD
jgi:SagB-type dehydrogenase family enzyme